jgi:hypothetical protein
MKEYIVRFRRIVDTQGVENWFETFSTIEDAQARIDEVNVEGSIITADPTIEEISDEE